MSSPRPWGCFLALGQLAQLRDVFPTPVGVFPARTCRTPQPWSLPHARGGVSDGRIFNSKTAKSSPRPWGCFQYFHVAGAGAVVFPTPVGVFPTSCCPRHAGGCLPHARGGVSKQDPDRVGPALSSPRPWGCFWTGWPALRFPTVFPTPVGVFPVYQKSSKLLSSLPHARGGVSSLLMMASSLLKSSPRPWGCFSFGVVVTLPAWVFPTPVGVFLIFFCSLDFTTRSSPRPWGCFLAPDLFAEFECVFPTPVGVFLHRTGGVHPGAGLPHARGGVSNY